jgi:acyl-CoA thioester hydrolase
MTLIAAPLRLYETPVLQEWIDYNGHMSEAYYVLVFGYATDAFYDYIGLDDAARRAAASSVYTVEAHINYLNECRVDDPLDIETQVLGYDSKRLVLFHAMRLGPGGKLLATTEVIAVHVDTTTLRTAPFLPGPAARIAEIAAAHAQMPRPPQAGRSIKTPQGPQ